MNELTAAMNREKSVGERFEVALLPALVEAMFGDASLTAGGGDIL
jgi:hypothetical protein